MEKILMRYLEKDYLPQWISLNSAFSCLQKLLSGNYVEHLKPEGSTTEMVPGKIHNLPGAQEMCCLRDKKPETVEGEEQVLIKVDEVLRSRLSDGTIKCRGKLKKTVRTLNLRGGDRDFRKDLEFEDHDQTAKSYKPIEQRFWGDAPWVSYKSSEITVFKMQEEDLHTDINRPDDYFVNLNFDPDEPFGEFENDPALQDFIWEEKWIDIEVCTFDFLHSTEALFEKYAQKLSEGKTSVINEHSALKGRNRFFYSPASSRWVVEYKNKVFSLNFREKSPLPLTIKYLLDNGSINIEEALENCNWDRLVGIGVLSGIRIGCSRQPLSDESSAGDYWKRYDELKYSLDEDGLSLHDREKNETEMYKIEKILLGVINKEKKPRCFRDLNLKRQKDAIRKRYRDFLKKIPEDGDYFKAHLEKSLSHQPKGIVYYSNEQWQTVVDKKPRKTLSTHENPLL